MKKPCPNLDEHNSLAEKLFSSFDPRGQGGMTNVIYLTQAFDPFWFPSDPAGDALDKSTPTPGYPRNSSRSRTTRSTTRTS